MAVTILILINNLFFRTIKMYK